MRQTQLSPHSSLGYVCLRMKIMMRGVVAAVALVLLPAQALAAEDWRTLPDEAQERAHFEDLKRRRGEKPESGSAYQNGYALGRLLPASVALLILGALLFKLASLAFLKIRRLPARKLWASVAALLAAWPVLAVIGMTAGSMDTRYPVGDGDFWAGLFGSFIPVTALALATLWITWVVAPAATPAPGPEAPSAQESTPAGSAIHQDLPSH